jgi:hypothetical protein
MKFNQNPFNGSRVVPYGPTDMTKLIVAFRSISKAPTNWPGAAGVCGAIFLSRISVYRLYEVF